MRFQASILLPIQTFSWLSIMLLNRESLRALQFIILNLFLQLQTYVKCINACSDCTINHDDMEQTAHPRYSSGYYVGSVETEIPEDGVSISYRKPFPQTNKIVIGHQNKDDYNGALIVSGGYDALSSSNSPSIQYKDNRFWSKYRQPHYAEEQRLRDRLHPNTFLNTHEHIGEVQLSPASSETHSVVQDLNPPNIFHQHQYSTSFNQHSQDESDDGALYNHYDSYYQNDNDGPYPYSGHQQPLPSITEAPQEERQQNTLFGYYYIGRKLWYIPLYFSIYFVLYVAALIIKSIGKHKIAFPQNLANTVNSRRSYDYQSRAHQMLESAKSKFGNKKMMSQ